MTNWNIAGMRSQKVSGKQRLGKGRGSSAPVIRSDKVRHARTEQAWDEGRGDSLARVPDGAFSRWMRWVGRPGGRYSLGDACIPATTT